MNINDIKPVLVKNPVDHKYYNLTPLFHYLDVNEHSFVDISDDIEKATELLPDLLETEEHPNREIHRICYYLNELKRCLRTMKPIEN